jgi:ABC-2 type transport system ATP-binding protein
MDATARAARVPEVLREVGLAGRGAERIRGYSKGMTQRVGLAQALVAEPDLVLLDEPTSALDPIGRREVRDLIGRLRRRDCAVLLNSHLLGEVEQVCDRVVIVDRGRVVHSGRMADLAAAGAELRLRLDRVDAAAVELAGGFGEVVAVEAETGTLLLAADAPDAAPALAAALVRSGYALHALIPQPRTLEDLFVSLVEETAG